MNNNNNISADWNNVVSNNIPANSMPVTNPNMPMNNNNPYVNNMKTKKKFKAVKKGMDPMKIAFIVIGVLMALICAFLLLFPLFNKKKGYKEGIIQANNFYSLKYNANEWQKNNNYLVNSKNSKFKVDNVTQTKAIEAYNFAKKDSRTELLYRLKSEYKRTITNVVMPDSDFKLLRSGVYLATFEYSTSNGSKTIKGKKYVVIAPDYNFMLTLTSIVGDKETYKEVDNEMLKILKTLNILVKRVEKTTNKNPTETNTNKPQTDKVVEQKNYQIIGSVNYGYMKVPTNWKRFVDKNSTNTNNMQYISHDLRYVVTMTALSKNANITPLDYLKSIEEKYKKSNVVQYAKMTRERVGIKKYETYRLDMYLEDDKVWMSVWVFRAEDDRIHFVSIEGSNNNSTVFNYINTYVLNRNDIK
jgi:hypothetical protein